MSPPPLQLGGDFQAYATSDPNQAADVFGYAVVPGRALLSSALLPGQKLNTAINGTLAVTRSRWAGRVWLPCAGLH